MAATAVGGLILAQAMFVHGVDPRIAYAALSSRLVGTSGARILTVYGGVAAVSPCGSAIRRRRR